MITAFHNLKYGVGIRPHLFVRGAFSPDAPAVLLVYRSDPVAVLLVFASTGCQIEFL
jgi:hypothetical protein